MNLKNIEDVEECPHCFSSFGYYGKVFVSGWIYDNTLFEIGKYTGEREKYNHNMFDSLNYGKGNPTCYCMECDKPIGTVKIKKEI